MTHKAIAAYRQAIKLNPHDAAAISALGCLFEAQGENPEITLMFCRESVGLAPENALFRYRLGQLYSNQNRLEEALSEFQKAQELGYDAADDIKKTQAGLEAKNHTESGI
jgi:tetratricopeptide (TPR) repeat protein